MPTEGNQAFHHFTDEETEGTRPVSTGEETVRMKPRVSASESHALHLYAFFSLFVCVCVCVCVSFKF